MTLAVVATLVVVLARELVQPAFAVLTASIILYLAGVIDADHAFAGFSNEAPIVVGALLIFARGADIAGLLQPIVDRYFGSGPPARGMLAQLILPITGASAFLNNTTLVAMMIPAVLDLSRRKGLSPSRFLMPVSYAAILGGVITAVGTSTNLTVSGLLHQAGMKPLSLFELTPVGLPIAAAGTLVIILLAPRVLPERESSREAAQDTGRSFTVSMRVKRTGPLAGRTVAEAGLRQLQGVFLAEIERTGGTVAPVAPDEVLQPRDVLMFVGRVDQVVDLQRMRGLESTERRQIGQISGGRHAFYEVVIGSNLGLVGRSIRDIGFRSRYGAVVLALHRAGQRVEAKLGEVRLRRGDTLLILASLGFRDRWRDSGEFLLVAPTKGVPPTQPRKARIVALAGAGFVVLTGTGVTSILQGSLLLALVLIATRVLTLRQARDAVDLNIVVLIAAAFGLGAAVGGSGLADTFAGLLVTGLAPLGLVGALGGVLVATIILTELISHNGAAVLMFPIAVAVAQATTTDPRPFVIAVTLGASLSFLTPLGYQTNLMVYGIGGYRFTDFTRLGVPLNVVTVILSLVLIPIFFPF